MNLIQQLLGCQWGREISTPDDPDPCTRQAVGMTHLYFADDSEILVKLCAEHHERIQQETEPRDA